MTAARIWWVRHGPTHAKSMIGWTNLAADLSDTDAIARLSTGLPAHAPVISSDLSRARATADAIAGPRPRLAHDPRLREIHFGAWEGKTSEEADSPHLRAFWDQPGEVRAPGGESWNDIVARIEAALADLSQHGAEIIVVAHMGAIMAAIQIATGMPTTEAFSHRIEPLSVTRIDGNAVKSVGQLL